MFEFHIGRGYVYSIKYHIVWCVKNRNKILIPILQNKLVELLYKIAKDNNFKIEKIETDLDYVHLQINCSPQHYIPDMIKALKGVTARLLMKEYGDVIKESLLCGHLWNPSYFVATVSENIDEQIKSYIQSQSKNKV